MLEIDDKDDLLALINIVGSMVIPLLLLALISAASMVFHWDMPEADGTIDQTASRVYNETYNQTLNQTEETNKSTIIISMPLSKSETESAEKNASLDWRIDGCSEQDKNIMIGFRFQSNISDVWNISLFVNGRDVLENSYNRPIMLRSFERRAVNTYVNSSVIKRNGSSITFDAEIREGENIIDHGEITCILSGGGGASASVLRIAPTPAPTPVLTRIEVIPPSISMPEGAVKIFEAKGFDQSNNLMEIIFDWTSSNQTVGNISNNGMFNATNPGITEVVASNGSISGKATVVVREEPIPIPTLTPTSVPTAMPTLTSTPTQTQTPLPTPTITITPGPTSTLTPVPTLVITPTPAACDLYAVHDEGLGDSQFITINLTNRSASVLGPKYANYDFEGLDFDPITGDLFAGAGDEGNQGGKIYKINIKTGAKTLIGDTGLKGIEAMAFSANGSMWVWAADKGLAEINKNNGSIKHVYSSKTGIEGLAWNNQGTVLYASAGNKLYSYNFSKKVLVQLASNLPGKTEALEIGPRGMLLGGIHNSDSVSIFTYDPVALRVVAEDNFTLPYNDIEGIAWPRDCLVE